jgi:dTDP-4-dehydrorhamnose reductase
MTRADLCEERPEEARKHIVDGPLHLGQIGQRLGAGFVYYSSSYVFDGHAGPYGEDDPPNPINVYGRCKWEAEQAVKAQLDRWLILRTIVVYGPEAQGKNFVCQVLRAARNGRRLPVPVDQVSNTTYSEDLARSSVELAERNKAGVYHLAGADSLDRYTFGRLVCEVFGCDSSVLDPVPTSTIQQRAPRPLHAGLRVEKARAELRTPLRGALDGLRAMKEDMTAQVAVSGRVG